MSTIRAGAAFSYRSSQAAAHLTDDGQGRLDGQAVGESDGQSARGRARSQRNRDERWLPRRSRYRSHGDGSLGGPVHRCAGRRRRDRAANPSPHGHRVAVGQGGGLTRGCQSDRLPKRDGPCQ